MGRGGTECMRIGEEHRPCRAGGAQDTLGAARASDGAGMIVALRTPRLAHAPPEGRSRDVGRAAIASLWAELALFPKPGLVSLRDSGAHADMNASTFISSLFSLSRYFDDVAAAGAQRAPFARLQA